MSKREMRSLVGSEPPDALYRKQYNIGPSVPLLTLLHAEGGGPVSWACPLWGVEVDFGGTHKSIINARAETVASKPLFKQSFRRQRCVVPASGWFEWKREGPLHRPFFFQPSPAIAPGLLLAGIWMRREEQERVVLLTAEAEPVAAKVHDRMPVLIDPRRYEEWIDPDYPAERALELARIGEAELDLQCHEVSPEVNRVGHDHPGLVLPFERPPDPQGLLFDTD